MTKQGLNMKKTFTLLILLCLSSSTVASNTNLVFSYKNTESTTVPVDLTEIFKEKKALELENGTFTFHFRRPGTKGLMSLFGLSSSNNHNDYLNFYINRNGDKDTFGIEIRKNGQATTPGGNLIPNTSLQKTVVNEDTDEWHSVSYVFNKGKNTISIFYDGNKIHELSDSRFLADIGTIDLAYLGQTLRSGKNADWRFNGDIFYADLDKATLSDTDIQLKHTSLSIQRENALNEATEKRKLFGAKRSETEKLFVSGQEGASDYRIPSLFTTQKGTVIAAIDKRNQHGWDWGNIDTVIRRSTDGGITWQKDEVLLDLASQKYGTQNSAFLIDPVIVQDKSTDRIFMLVDMFPETKGFFGIKNNASEGDGHTDIQGKKYLTLYDDKQNRYTVRENGLVYDDNNKLTDYRVVVKGTENIARHDLGDLYRGDEHLGNIYLKPAPEALQHDAAPLQVKTTSYLWMMYSDDEGKSWSNPIDITSQVKADWMRFLGTGPGVGIQTKKGDLVVPVYYTNSNDKQSAATIISHDGGKTWHRGESPNDSRLVNNGGSRLLNRDDLQITESQLIELDNGDIKLFSRNLSGKVNISTSKDGGYTWSKNIVMDDILLDPYSQLSVIKYSKKINGKQYIVFANPYSSTSERVNGKVWLGEVQDNGDINWKYSTTITTKHYGYNSLTELPNGDIGLLYESTGSTEISYLSFNLQELLWQNNILHRDNRQKPFIYTRDVQKSDSLTKIGDGTIIKEGKGENQSEITVSEGILALNQSADANGKLQAFSKITVKNGATVRLDADKQIPMKNFTFAPSGGILDLNGHKITVEKTINHTNKLATILSTNSKDLSTINYIADSDTHFDGMIGSEELNIVLNYSPQKRDSSLKLNNHTLLDSLKIQNGQVILSGSEKPENSRIHKQKNVFLNENSSLKFNGNNIIEAENIVTSKNSKIIANTEKGNIWLKGNISGDASIDKHGKNTLYLSGEQNLNNNINIHQGELYFSGSLKNSSMVLSDNTLLNATGYIEKNIVLNQGSTLYLNSDTQSNDLKDNKNSLKSMLTVGGLNSQGGTIAFTIAGKEPQQWKFSQLIINGDVKSNGPIPVYIDLENENLPHKDIDKKYDPLKGISLIQVGGKTSLDTFYQANKTTIDGVYDYTLVAYAPGASNIKENNTPNAKGYYDFRLQSQLIDANGKPISPHVNAGEQLNAARAQLLPQIPSYISAGNAMLSVGNSQFKLFNYHAEPLLEAKENVFLSYRKGKYDYHSSQNFINNGFNTTTKLNGWMLGATPWTSDDNLTRFILAIAHDDYTVTPHAIDGESKGDYNSWSGYAKIKHTLPSDFYFSLSGSLHRHRGDINTQTMSGNQKTASLKANQTNIDASIGYTFNWNQFSLQPEITIGHRHLAINNSRDKQYGYQINYDSVNSWVTQSGFKMNWQPVLSQPLQLSLSSYYETSHHDKPYVTLKSSLANYQFSGGEQGDALSLRGAIVYGILPQMDIDMSGYYKHRLQNIGVDDQAVSLKLLWKF